MPNITYCTSKDCLKQHWCKRYISNNDLKGKIYSVSDFTPIGNDCEFFIDDVGKEENILHCEYCGEELHGEPQVGQLGLKYIHCDNCGKGSYNEELGEIELTSGNVTFPQHYFCYSDGKQLKDEFINEEVRKGLKFLEKNKEEDFVELGTGNTNICIIKYEGDEEYRIVVSKGYYDTNIPIKNLK